MVTSKISRVGDLLAFEVNGKPAIPYGYMSYQPTCADYAGFRKAGVRLYFTGVYAGDRGINTYSGLRPFRPGFWKARDVFDFSAADEDFRLIAGGSPREGTVPEGLFIIPRLMLEPPSWWEDENPDALARDFEGKSMHQSYSSEKWFADTIGAMEAFQAWLVESGWDAHVAGWHLACGATEEFMRPTIHPLQYTDYSGASKLAWREYVRELFGGVAAMNAAWGTDYASFDEMEPATPAQRMYAADTNGERSPMAAEYWHFHSVENARAVCRLAHEAKRITGGERVVGAFFGYCGLLRGHTATDMVLRCPDVDFLASPFSYGHARAAGIDWLVGGPTGSCQFHGKAWFMEADVRTHLSRSIRDCMSFAYPANHHYDLPVWYGPDTEELSLHQMKKAWARSLCTGCAIWWFDMWGGWYRTDAMMAFHEKARALYEEATLGGGYVSRSQVAVFRDEREGEWKLDARSGEVMEALSRTGAVYTQYLLSDLPEVSPERYRAVIIAGAKVWTRAHAEALKAWMAGGRSVILIDSPEAEAAFFDEACAVPTGADESARVMVKAGYQLYRVESGVTAAQLREAFLLAGAHIYNFTEDIIYAAGDIVAIHAASDGIKRITLPVKGELCEVFTGERPRMTDFYADMTMEKGETRIFRVTER